jgi:hypothetical protein
MTGRLPFIDSDAHVLEPVGMFEKYLEPKFRDRMPYACADYQGEPLAFGFELRIPAPNGDEYVMPFGRDPLRCINWRWSGQGSITWLCILRLGC